MPRAPGWRVSPPNSGSQSGRGSAETLALKPKAKSLVPGGKEYSRKRSSLWEAANPGWSFLNILSSGKGIRGLWIVVAITVKNGRETREGGGKRRQDEGSEGERANLSPSPPGILCFGNGVGKTSPSISFPDCPLISLYYFSKNQTPVNVLGKVHNAGGYRLYD